MNKKRTKAFTLTELLVVVIVLGVLAAVAVPKFTRVLETRRTTEAENMLSAVRMEQEKRCSLGQNYTGDFGKIGTVAYARTGEGRAQSANYTYALTETGVSASRDGKEYVLKMPSYKSGEICCEGEGCESLNKSYPLCSEVTVEADECAADVCEYNPNSCLCPAYAQRNQCECAPSAATCCAPGEVYVNGKCMTKCEANPSTANCCTATQISQGMVYNPLGKLGSSACSCPSGTTLVQDLGSSRGNQHCCPTGNVYKDGRCMTLCEARPSTENCCSGGQEWNGSSCECPEGTTWNGTSCEEVCEDSYGTWQTTMSWGTNECNGDFENAFSCGQKKSGVNFSCTDYITQYETVAATAWSRYQIANPGVSVGGTTVNGGLSAGARDVSSNPVLKTLAASWTDPFVSFAGPETWTAQLQGNTYCAYIDCISDCPFGSTAGKCKCCPSPGAYQVINGQIVCKANCNTNEGEETIEFVNCASDEVCSNTFFLPTGNKCLACCKKTLWTGSQCCTSGQHVSNGHCCPTGQEWNGSKCAVPSACEEPFEEDSSGNCVCPSGYPYEYNGKCYKCPGAEYEFANGQCRKPVYKKRSVSCCANMKVSNVGGVGGFESQVSGRF